MKKTKTEQRFCGNCDTHVPYNYPDDAFCSKRLAEGKNPVVRTLWCCEDWDPAGQECYCVQEATRNKASRNK
jgi:hypothetical protein